MSTENYQIAKSRQNTKARLLLDIELYGTGNASEMLYLSGDYVTVDGTRYEGIVESFGSMDKEVPNEGFASVNDFSITLQNTRLQFMESDTCMSDLMDTYYFTGSRCKIYQWFDELTSKDDAELIFDGIAKQPTFDKHTFSFDIEEKENIREKLPTTIVTLKNYSNAPEESIGNPIPIVYGDDWEVNDYKPDVAALTPCLQTDKFIKEFYVANHIVEHDNITGSPSKIRIYFSDVGYGKIIANNATYTNSGSFSRFTLNDNILYQIQLLPKIKGSQYSAGTLGDDYDPIIDGDSGTSASISASEKIYLKLDAVPPNANLEATSSPTIKLYVTVANVSGSNPYGSIKYYNSGFDAGTGSFSTGIDISTNGIHIYDIYSDKSAHGTEGSQDDQNDAWTYRDLMNCEFGFEAGAGDSFDISRMYLYVANVPYFYEKRGRQFLMPGFRSIR